MKKLLLLLSLPFMMMGCLDDDSLEMSNTKLGNFEACWRAVDEHYCFFEEKNIDWNKVHRAYEPYFRDSVKTLLDEFYLMGNMLANLRDGHVDLYAAFDVARYWKWSKDYPPNFDANLVDRFYLKDNQMIASGIRYQMLPDSVGYVRYASFASAVGESNLDYVLYLLRQAKGLIIDIRDNGGGALTNVPLIANRFCTEKQVYGYMKHKTGPGHNEFSEPKELYLEPEKNRVFWDASTQPVVVLTNRSVFSAANTFVAAMQSLDGTMTKDSLGVPHPKIVKVVGDSTGGGGGMPFETVLPVGWRLRMSACPILDRNKKQIEAGIAPDFRVEMDSLNAFNNHVDDIIEYARTYINNNTRKEYPPKKE
ncbi:MAG: S41 family peptidase [Bacteroidales bacterium]|nr:S41 family peptidase [Bacteroidales bacterium]